MPRMTVTTSRSARSISAGFGYSRASGSSRVSSTRRLATAPEARTCQRWDLPSTGSPSPTGNTANPANMPNGVHLVLRRSAYFNKPLCKRLRFFNGSSAPGADSNLSTWPASTGLASDTASWRPPSITAARWHRRTHTQRGRRDTRRPFPANTAGSRCRTVSPSPSSAAGSRRTGIRRAHRSTGSDDFSVSNVLLNNTQRFDTAITALT